MITLKTLKSASLQDIFDQAAKHLLTQMAVSRYYPLGFDLLSDSPGDAPCAYRGVGGLKCVVGCFMEDDEYGPEFEGIVWGGLLDNGDLTKYGLRPGDSDHPAVTLLRQLQPIHDYSLPSEWAGQLERLALKNGLEFKGVEYYSGAGQ